MPRHLAIAIVAALLIAQGTVAHAQAQRWGVSLAVPLGLRFTDDPQTPTPPPASFPTGLRVALLTPVYVGVGLAQYRTAFDRAEFPAAGRRMQVRLAEVQGMLPVPDGWVALGYGRGKAEFQPVTATGGIFTQEFLPSDTEAWFALAAFELGGHWEAQLGFHLLQVHLWIRTNGAGTTGRLDAQLLTAGAGYRF
jgi:hypothetical protein